MAAWSVLGVLLGALAFALVPQPAATRAVATAPRTAIRIRLLFLNFISSVINWLLLQLCDDGMQRMARRMATERKAFGKVSESSAM
jgi:hypothetical protein